MRELIKAGSTSVLREIIVRSAVSGQGITGITAGSVVAAYMRQGASSVTALSLTGGTLGSYVSSTWTEASATLFPGVYQIGLPDACFATGAASVMFIFQYTGALERVLDFQLTGADLSNSTNLGLTDIDAAISSRSTYAGTDTPGTTTLLTDIGTAGVGLTNLGDTRIAYLDANVSSRATPAQILLNPANLLSVNVSGYVTVGSYGSSGLAPDNTDILNYLSNLSAVAQRVLSLVGDNQGVPSGSVTLDVNSNPVSYVICGYDTAAHAATNDGITGVINKVSVENAYNLSGWVSTSIQRIL